MHSRSPKSSNLFSGPKSARAPHTAHVDGGARGNPGPAGYGVAINDASGHPVAELSEYLGHHTNNYAEYQGLLAALRYAAENQIKALKVISDSELMVRQIKGIYKVKEPVLRDLHGRAKELISKLVWFQIEHVLRGHNREADELANAAMDKGSGRTSSSVPVQNAIPRQEFNGVVRAGKIELLDGSLPDGTAVQVRVKR